MTNLAAVRRFLPAGIRETHRFLDGVQAGGHDDPMHLLEDPDLTEVVSIGALEIVQLSDRRQTAEVMRSIVDGLDMSIDEVQRDVGLWTWLAMCWFDQLAPRLRSSRTLRKRATLVLAADDFRTYYRHYLAGPWSIYMAHLDDPDRAQALLCTKPWQPGEVVEQMASRQDIVSSPSVVQVVTNLYLDPESGSHKVGAAGKAGGSARRLADVLLQLDLTWDIHQMTPDDIIDLLPEEFDRFR
jgi:hypothetical protein